MSPLPWTSRFLEWPLASTAVMAALGGGRLAVATADRKLQVVAVATDTPQVVYQRPLPWNVEALSLSPSGRHLLLRHQQGTRLTVWDLEGGLPALDLGSEQARPQSVVGSFVRSAGNELLLASSRPGELEGYELIGRQPVLYSDCRAPLAFRFHVPGVLLGDGDSLCIIGYLYSDGMDTLVMVSLRDLMTSGRVLLEELKAPRRIHDRAYRLAAGPCGQDAVILFRDPEEDEMPEPGEQLADASEVYNFRGFYVRRLADGTLRGRVEVAANVGTGARLMAVAECIVACMGADRGQQCEIRALAGGAVLSSYPGNCCALDSETGQVAIVRPGGIELLSFG